MEKKYKLIKSDIRGLYRIKALRDFGDVKKWDIGGYVKSENNLSHVGDCWVYDNAIVHDNSRVYHNAKIYDNAKIFDDVRILDNAIVGENAQIHNNVHVFDSAIVGGHALIHNNVRIHKNVRIYDDAEIYHDAVISDYAVIRGKAIIYGTSEIRGNSYITGDTQIKQGGHLGYIDEKFKNILYIKCQNRLITVYKDLNNIIKCNIGCQHRMTVEDLLKRIEEDGGMNEHREEYVRIMKNAHLLLG